MYCQKLSERKINLPWEKVGRETNDPQNSRGRSEYEEKVNIKNGAKVNSKERRKYKGFKSQDREVGTKKYGQ